MHPRRNIERFCHALDDAGERHNAVEFPPALRNDLETHVSECRDEKRSDAVTPPTVTLGLRIGGCLGKMPPP